MQQTVDVVNTATMGVRNPTALTACLSLSLTQCMSMGCMVWHPQSIVSCLEMCSNTCLALGLLS